MIVRNVDGEMPVIMDVLRSDKKMENISFVRQGREFFLTQRKFSKVI